MTLGASESVREAKILAFHITHIHFVCLLTFQLFRSFSYETYDFMWFSFDYVTTSKTIRAIHFSPDKISVILPNSVHIFKSYLYERVNGIFLSTVDLYFLEEWKIRLKSTTRSYVLQTIHNFSSIGPRFLVMELIARKRQDSEATFVLSIWEFLHECIQVRVLDSEPSKCRHIEDQRDLSLEVF